MSVTLYIILFSLVFIYLSKKMLKRKKHNPPPGPRGWPFLGYINFIFSNTPTNLLSSLSDKYGNVFGFYLGTHYCVVVSDFKSTKEAFGKKTYLDRPPGYLASSTENIPNFTQMLGAEWEDHRMFLVNSLKGLGVGRNQFEDVVLGELSRAINKMEVQVGKQECNIRTVISGSISNIMFQLICSRWFEDDDPFMKDYYYFQDIAAESFSNNMSFIFFPWVTPFLLTFQTHMKNIFKSMMKMETFVRSEIEAHEKVHTEDSRQDYIDLFLTEMKLREKKDLPTTFNKGVLLANALLLLNAGADTIRNTIEWLLMSMALHQDIQEKVFQEINSVLGGERAPQFSDKADLPFTEACILESARRNTLTTLNALHSTSEDSVLQGYTIPKGSIVINNIWKCHMDPSYWKSPEEFIPERFLSADKTRVSTPQNFLPFSIGKRDCPGSKVAVIEVFLYFTTIIQKFKLFPPDGGVCFDSIDRINRQAVKPIVRLELR